jgi:hypothetical protein
MAVAADTITGAGQSIAAAVQRPMIAFKYQPGVYRRVPNDKGRTKTKRIFVANPRFPDGLWISVPTWFMAIFGVGITLYILNRFLGLLDNFGTSKKEDAEAARAAEAERENQMLKTLGLSLFSPIAGVGYGFSEAWGNIFGEDEGIDLNPFD